jgi:hypothetical protein
MAVDSQDPSTDPYGNNPFTPPPYTPPPVPGAPQPTSNPQQAGGPGSTVTPPIPPPPGPTTPQPTTPTPTNPGGFVPTPSPGTPTGGNPFQGSSYNPDPSKAAMTFLNSPLAGSMSSQQVVDYLNSAYGGSSGQPAVYAGQGPGGSDIISFSNPNGYLAKGADGQWGWNPRSGGPTSNTGNPPPSGAYVPGTGVPGMGTIFGPTNPNEAAANALFAQLMGQAQTDLTLSPNDPIIKPQVDAYDATQQQNARNYESQVAESGRNSINPEAVDRSEAEQIGQNTASYQANLMGTELAARRQEIQQALSGAEGLLTAEQQMQLNEELQQLSLAEQAFRDTNTANNPVTNPTSPTG